MWNLVDNAVRHDQPGGWIRVATARYPGGAILRIANSGAVVPEGALLTLVEPFRRIEGTGGDGVCLGLSVAQSVSTAHGARLDAGRQPGGGLSITVITTAC